MTRPLNFTVKEVLPALLSKAKTQTIRKAWQECYFDHKDDNLKENCTLCNGLDVVEKPATYKVGDKVNVYWNQRSKYKKFCCCHGMGYDVPEKILQDHHLYSLEFFWKNLGRVEITEVLKIELQREPHIDLLNGIPIVDSSMTDLWEKDGFSSAEQMFETIDKMYNLSKPKPFYIYRFKWI